MGIESLLRPEESGIPVKCSKCGGKMVYKGLGEYCCSQCRNVEYDSYGEVRAYLEKHPGASIPDICQATGLTRAEIMKMVEEDKFQIKCRS